MLVQSQSGSQQLACAYTQMLQLLQHDGRQQAIDLWAEIVVGPVINSVLYRGTPNVENCYIAQGNEDMVCIFGCCPSLLHGTAYLAGFRQADRADNLLGMHPLVEASFEYWVPILAPFLESRRQRVCLFAGHSYGGGVALAVATAAAAFDRNRTVRVTTFGSPRNITAKFGPVLNAAQLDVHRFMNEGDPIPLLPPHYAEDVEAYAWYSIASMQNVARWLHCGEGTLCMKDGSFQSRNTPDPSVVPPGVSIAGWATSLLATPVFEHAIPTYAGRFSYVIDELLQPDTAPPDLTPPAPPPTLEPNPPIPPAVFQGLPAVDPPNVRAAVDAAASLPLSSFRAVKPFYAAKVRKQWYVWHHADPIVSCKGGREARRIAGRYNSIAGQWNRASQGDQDALLAAVEFEFPNE